jgi:threonine-phosphate decarboxylase
MIQGHGDDTWRFDRPIRANFSSNVYSRVDLTALKAHLAARLDAIGHYPEPEPYALERALALQLGLDPSAVCVTNGATEAIYLTAHAFAGSQATILQPTFSEYADACTLYRHHLVPCAAPPGPRATCWICNPNNPTGDVIPKDDLIKTIEDHPKIVFVIDQSYGFFTQEPLLSAAEAVAFPNVIQLHSMTKRYAMPGLRLGYITANPQLLDCIRAVRMPWSVNALAVEAGLYLTAHPDTAPIDLAALLREAERLRGALDALPGLTALPTRTHFFLCRLDRGCAADLKQWLAVNHGILIRDAANFEGLDERYFRIATQTPEENSRLVAVIRQYLKEVAS